MDGLVFNFHSPSLLSSSFCDNGDCDGHSSEKNNCARDEKCVVNVRACWQAMECSVTCNQSHANIYYDIEEGGNDGMLSPLLSSLSFFSIIIIMDIFITSKTTSNVVSLFAANTVRSKDYIMPTGVGILMLSSNNSILFSHQKDQVENVKLKIIST